jgi:hypothetical protein
MRFIFDRTSKTSRIHPDTLKLITAHSSATATICFGADERDARSRFDNAAADVGLISLTQDASFPTDVVALPEWIEQCVGGSQSFEHVLLIVDIADSTSFSDAGKTSATLTVISASALPTWNDDVVTDAMRRTWRGAAVSGV